MRTGKPTKKSEPLKRDPKKEHVFKELSDLLSTSGVNVRRERLKQGLGWKVISGSCRAHNNNLVFIDRRLPQDEQIAFLLAKISSLQLQIPEDKLQCLPEHVRNQYLLAAA